MRDERARPTTRLQHVEIPGPAGAIEGVLQEHHGAAHPLAAIVCHPHPQFGGTLHNKVTHKVAATLHGLGAAALRFNFRGVGRSAGSFDGGRGEREDARAALAWLAARHPRARRWVAGFSFGSWIAAGLAASDPSVERLILVAPPVARSDFSALREARVPKLVVQGTDDDLCPPEALRPELERWAEPKRLILVEGATHFFDRRLGELAEALLHALREPATGATSSSG
jgi:hypothetical protein